MKSAREESKKVRKIKHERRNESRKSEEKKNRREMKVPRYPREKNRFRLSEKKKEKRKKIHTSRKITVKFVKRRKRKVYEGKESPSSSQREEPFTCEKKRKYTAENSCRRSWEKKKKKGKIFKHYRMKRTIGEWEKIMGKEITMRK